MDAMPNAPVISNDSQWKSRDRPVDPAVADLAHRQHGVVSRAQLVAAGVGVGAIEWRLARQRLHPVHAGVYAVGHGVLTSEGRLMAAVLAGGRDAVLSHRAAAAHWGIRQSQARDMDVTTPRKLRCRPGLRFHEAHLPKDEVTTRDRIPVTTVPRTLFDLAGEVPHHQLERAVNEAEIRHLWDPLCLADLLAGIPPARAPGRSEA
jgi:predicted transcriptional regulator of viral defense system